MLKVCALIYLMYLQNMTEAAFKDFIVEKEADLERFDYGEVNEFNDECDSAGLIDEYGVDDADDIDEDDSISKLRELLENNAIDTKVLVQNLQAYAKNLRSRLSQQSVSEDSFHAFDEWHGDQGCSEGDE